MITKEVSSLKTGFCILLLSKVQPNNIAVQYYFLIRILNILRYQTLSLGSKGNAIEFLFKTVLFTSCNLLRIT